MLLRDPELAGIVEGRTDLVFRTWKRPTVSAGGTLRTRRWLLAIHAVDPIDRSKLTEEDARRSGHSDLADLLDDLGDREGQLYRVHVTCAGDDPRIARRNSADLTAEDREAIAAAL